MTQCKTAVFGSAFNPPHMGHADVINQVLAVFDRVIVVPSFTHAFGKTMAAYSLRLNLAQILVSSHPDWQQRVIVSDVEQTIATKKSGNEPVYTFDVLSKLEALRPSDKLVFVVGPDNAAPDTWAKFYKANEIDERWGRWEAQERKKIRSTAIRNKLKAGEKPSLEECPPVIWQAYQPYINEFKLVQENGHSHTI